MSGRHSFSGNTKHESSYRAASHNPVQRKSVSLADNRLGSVAQLATSVTWTTQNFQYNDANNNALSTQPVGKKMVADLDPNDLQTGNSTTSKEMPDLFAGLKAHWDPGSKHWVRGHLLNDHLGGPNTDPNLFPITGHANLAHLNAVESHVKDWMRAGRNVRYQVDAEQNGGNVNGLRNAAGKFVCYAYTTSGGAREVVNKTILSTPHTIIGGAGGTKSDVEVHDKNWWQYNNTKVGNGGISNNGLNAANAGLNEHNRTGWNANHINKGYFWDNYTL